ncbi:MULTISPECIES: tetratricopeptide repeat protein [unclassified Campylobacter]|uniref:tetratricopeptide repeat protein n=1 Tax=unclassified Campylobacter TaxID=2593542 RepID=UPI001237E51D|nr:MULTISPECIES: ATP-dependent nuclease subunit B [unclassified Campylobacter]KAA6226434.1 ATP-dependent nuclease subunit B [Campylobacter sp. LR286c]KAA6226528.1 ATP-dependent nuclease subunit B [Campylobacter sp. LR185c]KAA6226922.1 ATP-dependent nuclease subunit B [Campylobacter sp. LR196d]KAA6233666.1 ATP-dependent nuclease subunit B [Campylobacter sp. LR291e]KAA6233886.1 ATP-dependent nuclease subunit B [Campylobacter sp. LR264d]
MYRNLFFILIVALFLGACTTKNIVVYKEYESNETSINKRIMQAFNYEKVGKSKEARTKFLELFNDYNSTIFLENAYLITLSHNLDKTDELENLVKQNLYRSDNLKRLSVLYALQTLNLDYAQKLCLELLAKKDNDPRNFELYADVLIRKNKLKEALIYYRLAYAGNVNEDLLLKIVSVYALLNDKNNAKIMLENFRQSNGCTIKTCLILGKIYSEEQNLRALKELYIELYDITSNQDFILSLVRMFDFKEEKKEALDLALKYDLNDEIKLYLYQSLKFYDKAKELCLQLYEEKKDDEFILQAAMFEFEELSLKKQVNKNTIKPVIEKFEKMINENSDDLYLNYYGYLLIDNDLEIEKGMKLVELALQKDPGNLYYIDSLAWGYYKLGDCNKAYEIISQTFKDLEFKNSNESKAHIRAIKACMK